MILLKNAHLKRILAQIFVELKFIYFDLLTLMFFASFNKNQHYDFFPLIDTDHFTLSENNFSLSQFLQKNV